MDAVNAVLLNSETQAGYGDRVQTAPSGAPSVGHWPIPSNRSQQQQQASSQMLPSMVSPSVPVALCPARSTLMQSQVPLQVTGGQQVARHSVEHTYQRHSPYPNPNAGLRPSAQVQSVVLHHGLSRVVSIFTFPSIFRQKEFLFCVSKYIVGVLDVVETLIFINVSGYIFFPFVSKTPITYLIFMILQIFNLRN